MTQSTSGGAVTADSRFIVLGACGLAGWLALLLTKAGDVEANNFKQESLDL